eukprot:TRINITY_DN10535_c0_g1_i1.p1 TRINITY_DN10535_c0_g1~~TRINITY_DN10535_c0_g1_i1.p1  ORF type:complete len:622 (+),score=121.88 TRINITY_DN10535_c0_g1_i1:103-1968(+)
MRVRLRIVANDGETAKLWTVVPKEAKTIKCFMKHVAEVTNLPHKSIILNIEGFELPAKQPIELIRENDIINVKAPFLSKESKKSSKKSKKSKKKNRSEEAPLETGTIKKSKCEESISDHKPSDNITIVNEPQPTNGTEDTEKSLEEAKAKLLERLLGNKQPVTAPTIDEQLAAQIAEEVEQPEKLTLDNAEAGLKIRYELEEISFENGKLIRDVTQHHGTIISIDKEMLTILGTETERAHKVHITTLLNPTISISPDIKEQPKPSPSEQKQYDGTVREWEPNNSFGFIFVTELDLDVFCHKSSIQSGTSLQPGSTVQLFLKMDQNRGKFVANNVTGEGVITPKRCELRTDIPHSGTVKVWLDGHGYGFITLKDYPVDVFCHQRTFLGDALIPGKPVEIWLERDNQNESKYVATWVHGPGVLLGDDTSSVFKNVTVTGVRSWAQPGKLGDCIQKKYQLTSVGYVTINKDLAEAVVPIHSREDYHKIGSDIIKWDDLKMTSPSVTVTGVPGDVSPGRVASAFCKKFNVPRVGFVDVCRQSGKAFIPDVDPSLLLLMKDNTICWEQLAQSVPAGGTHPEKKALPGVPGPVVRPQPKVHQQKRKPRLGTITTAISLLKSHEEQSK